MQTRNTKNILIGIFRLCHPIPVAFHLLAVTLFALLAAWPHINPRILILLILAHAAMQAAIAVLNDYCDRHLDALSHRPKPIVQGLIRPHEALLLGLLLILIMLLLLLFLNLIALLISLLYLTLGLAYNLGLKSTPWSGILFALAIPLIPIYAFAAMNHLTPHLLWLIPVAALLGTALNLANSLPDLEADAVNRTRTLAVTLGLRRTLIACTLLLITATLLITILSFTSILPAQPWLLLPTLDLTLLFIIISIVYTQRMNTPAKRKLYFYLTVTTCLILGCGWLLSLFF